MAPLDGSSSNTPLVGGADAALIEAGRRWTAALHQVNALGKGGSLERAKAGPELNDAISLLMNTALEIDDLPCSTPAGAVVKLQVALHGLSVAGLEDDPNWRLIRDAALGLA